MDLLLFCELICTDGYKFKIPVPVHQIDLNQVGEFSHTWTAPGCPDIDQGKLFRLFLNQFFHAIRADFLKLYFFLQDLLEGLY